MRVRRSAWTFGMEFPHLERPRERRVLLVAAAGMVSKRRRQGKRGNILLAMPQARFSRTFEFHPAKIRTCLRRGQHPGRRAGGMAGKS
jgi:hypothetical protein